MNSSLSNIELSHSNDSQLSMSNISRPDKEHPYSSVYILAGDIYFYALAIILPVGFVGNLFSICVFLVSPALRRTTTGLWLIALGIADCFVLFGETTRWLAFTRHVVPNYYYIPKSWKLNFLYTSNYACNVIYVIKYGSYFCSSWLTVAVSIERLIAVARPLEAGRILTRRRTAVLIAIIVLVGFSLSLFPLWTVERDSPGEDSQCKYIDDSGYYIWVIVSGILFSLFLPGVCLTALTGAIIFLLYKARSIRRHRLGTPSNVTPHIPSLSCNLSQEAQMTMTLISICVATICLRAPYTLAFFVREAYVWKPYRNKQSVDEDIEARTYLIMYITDVVRISKIAANLLLYCLCGSYFRNEAMKLACFWVKQQGPYSIPNVRRTMVDTEEQLRLCELDARNCNLEHSNRHSITANNVSEMQDRRNGFELEERGKEAK